MNPIAWTFALFLIAMLGSGAAAADPTAAKPGTPGATEARARWEQARAEWGVARIGEALRLTAPAKGKWSRDALVSPDGRLHAAPFWNARAGRWETRVWDADGASASFGDRWELRKWLEQRGSLDAAWADPAARAVWKRWAENATAADLTWAKHETARADWVRVWDGN
jgi:hypothetical protein